MSVNREIELVTKFLSDTLGVHRSMDGYVVGLSGGIDSAVVAALAKRAIDRRNRPIEGLDNEKRKIYKLQALMLPIDSNSEDARIANLVATSLGIETVQTVDLSQAYAATMLSLSSLFPENLKSNPSVASIAVKSLGNVKARMRMTALYYAANVSNLLVLGTDNLSESYTGYFTKHGDGAADVFPIAKYVKREVYEMARELQLPQEVIDRKPSAGLWDGQTDESEMGVPYDFIDNHIENLDYINRSVYPDDYEIYMDKLLTLHHQSRHKRNPPIVFER